MFDRGLAQLAPTGAKRQELTASGHRLASLVAEPVGPIRGTLLLLPGITGSKEDFAPILDPLAAQGFRAVAIDQLGQYQSPGTPEESDYQPASLGAIAAALVQQFATEGPVVLLGHSYGGLVARAAVLGGCRPAGLILLDTGARAVSSPDSRASLEQAEQAVRTQGLAATFELRRQAEVQLGVHYRPELVDFYRQRFIATEPANLLGIGRALLTEPDRTAELAEALTSQSIPVAVICGEEELAWPLPEQHEMAAGLGTDLIVIPGAGHSPAVEAPTELVAVLLPLLQSWTSA